MKTILEDRVLILKFFQLVGGIVAIFAGIILINSDTQSIATISLGAYGITFEVSAISGVTVIIAGLFLIFRSGGGIRGKAKKHDAFSDEEIELTVDAYEDLSKK